MSEIIVQAKNLTFQYQKSDLYFSFKDIKIKKGDHTLLSPLLPSTYLLVALAGVEFGDHLKFTLKWAIGSGIVMLLAAIGLGVI